MVGKHDAIGVVDFGGQYAHLIATKVRRAGVYAEIRQPEDETSAFQNYKGVILSGSPSLASHGEDDDWNKEILDLDIPILGFCFGHQEIAKHYGGTVVHGGREWGAATLHVKEDHPLFSGQPREQTVWMSHFDSVTELGPEFREVGYTTMGDGGAPHPNAAIASDSLRRYGFQYHPEVGDTEYGQEMIANFARNICECAPTWSMDAVVEEQIAAIQKQVGEQSVFLLASGGVDSTVAAKLIAMALPEGRLKLLHVDNGMMRKGESAAVMELLASLGMGDNAHFVDASEDFLEALAGEIEPEKKRHSIGQTFVDVFEQEASRLGIEDHLLGQPEDGYPDTVETGGTKRAHTIKTHHNRVPIIEQMMAAGRVIEPLADLYKVEVRELGRNWESRVKRSTATLSRTRFGCTAFVLDGTVMAPPVGFKLNQELAEFGLSGNALPIRSVRGKPIFGCMSTQYCCWKVKGHSTILFGRRNTFWAESPM